jgi:hypothetical protein
MAGNYMTMPITPLCLEVRNIVFQNNEATYAYSSEIQKEIRWLRCNDSDKFERSINGILHHQKKRLVNILKH